MANTSSKWLIVLAAVIATAVLAALPLGLSRYGISSGIVFFATIALATAWAFFSGPTRYISLATATFVGIGMYTVAFATVSLPLWVALVLAPGIGFAFALVVGLSTLRLRGVYFVIFTFGLTELMRQLVNWYEINVTGKVNRFLDVSASALTVYEMMLVLAVISVLGSWYVGTTRLGHALRAVGEDETVARHTGINTTWTKVLVFAIASSMMALVGGVYALRYPSIDPTVGFSNSWSFTVLIAALLGGPGRSWGPAIGAVLLVLLSDFIVANFSRYFSIGLGICFVVIVYFIPGGVAPRIEQFVGYLARTGVMRGVLASWRKARERSAAPHAAPPPAEPIAAVAPEPVASPVNDTPDGGALLRVSGLRKAFGGLVAVRDLSFEIPHGSIIGLIGPNGSGKTTVLNLITGELPPDAGSILLDGREIIGAQSFQVSRSRIARTFQLVRVLPSMTTRENIMLGRMFGSDPVGPSRAFADSNALLERVGLAGQADQFGAQLTYIDQKRAELARALATRPQLLLLDEWLAGLNPTELKIGIALIRQIRKEGISIVLVEHVMEAIRALCDHVVVMNAGERIADGTPDEVLSDARVMQVYLGEDDAAA